MLRNRKGFTLIELLIVVVIIGILAAIALPRFGQTRERAWVSAMQSDLRNLQTAQEMYFQDFFNYITTANIPPATEHVDLGFRTSNGVTIDIVPEGASGYRATANHEAFGAAGQYPCVITISETATGGIVCSDNR